MDGIVYRSNGYKPLRVSTHAIEAIIGNNSVGLHALTHPYRGHWFYCLTTLDNRTLVYDVATGKWHERSTSADGSGPWQAWVAASTTTRCNCSVIGRVAALHARHQADRRGRDGDAPGDVAAAVGHHAARVLCPCGDRDGGGRAATPGDVLLDWSDDGGRTWGPARTLSAGAPAKPASGSIRRGWGGSGRGPLGFARTGF